MAKITTCAFCGKELTKTFFGGTAEELTVADDASLTCCEECRRKYKTVAKQHRARFSVKLANYKWVNRAKPTPDQIAAMYRRYLAEYETYKPRFADTSCAYRGWFFKINESGCFGLNEKKLGFLSSNISRDDKIKAYVKDGIDECPFTRDDISCIEFRLTDGSFNGLFHQMYSLEIRLNKAEELTYRPTFAITVVESKMCLLGFRRSARKEAIKLLEDFKAAIGSDLPIVEVKRFR